MHSRRALAATIVALVALSGARVVDAAASPTPGKPPVVVVHSPATTAPATPAPSRGTALEQTVQLAVVGGDIELETTAAEVVLSRVPGSDRDWVGTLPSVRLVDARGTLEGWEVRWWLHSLEVNGSTRVAERGAAVEVQPDAPVVVDGAPEGLHAGNAKRSRASGRMLFEAEQGNGGGTYEAAGMVGVRLPPSADAEHVVVHLTFALH